MKKIQQYPCRRCGADMTIRESSLGSGYCFVCAPLYSPAFAGVREQKREEQEATQ